MKTGQEGTFKYRVDNEIREAAGVVTGEGVTQDGLPWVEVQMTDTTRKYSTLHLEGGNDE